VVYLLGLTLLNWLLILSVKPTTALFDYAILQANAKTKPYYQTAQLGLL
jgi:hypothetical protein